MMSAGPAGQDRNMDDESILNFVQDHEDPCVTAGEIAAEFGVTNEAVNYRLNQLKQEGKVQDKKVGASAKIWYLKS